MLNHDAGPATGTARALAHALAARAEAVCRHYLPQGRRSGRYWTAGDVHGVPGRSLYVRLAPPGTVGWWTDAATGERGDLLELLRCQRGEPGMAGAMAEARRFLGGAAPPSPAPAVRPNAHGRGEAPQRLWALCRPLDGTPAEAYLRARGILSCRHPALGFHPALYYRDQHRPELFRRLPALVARAMRPCGAFAGLQRIYLDPARPAKAPVADAKKGMGSLRGAAVALGTLGAGTLVVAEGVETALSLLTARPALRGAAALSAAGLAVFTPPDGAARVLIARDNDRAGIDAAARLLARCRARALPATVLVPAQGDFNDELRARGAEALGARIDAALRSIGATGPETDT